MATEQFLSLSNGEKMPIIGYGTFDVRREFLVFGKNNLYSNEFPFHNIKIVSDSHWRSWKRAKLSIWGWLSVKPWLDQIRFIFNYSKSKNYVLFL